MRVYARYSQTLLDLGEMPILPEPGDKIELRVPHADGDGHFTERMTVEHRIFFQAPYPRTITEEVHNMHVDRGSFWACRLILLDQR